MAMNEIISSYTYYKEQDEMYFKKQHSKEQIQMELNQLSNNIQGEVKILIQQNKTNKTDFNKLFNSLTESNFIQIKKIFDLSESNESKKKILQKIYHYQKDLTHFNKQAVQNRIFGVGIDELFNFVKDHGETIINEIKQQYDHFNPQFQKNLDFNKIFHDILKGKQKKSKKTELEKSNLLNIVKQFVLEMEDSLLKENDDQSKIKDMESIVNNTVIKQQKNNAEIHYFQFIHFLKKIGLFLIFKKLQNTEREEINQLEKEQIQFIQIQRQICEEVFNDALDNSEKGKKAAILASEKLIESFENIQEAKIELEVKQRINSQFPTPKSLNEQAYNMSFKDKNFPNIIKYINNITNLITELCDPIKQKQKDWIESQRTKFLNELKDVFQEVLNSCTNWNDSLHKNQSSNFSQIFKTQNLRHYSKNLHIEIYNKIAIRKEFVEGFIKQFEEQQANLPKICENLVIKLIQFSDKEVVQKSINAQGCQDRCPYCYNKCSEISGHDGDHKVIQHLSLGFSGYHDHHTKKVILSRCIDQEKYKYDYIDFEKEDLQFICLDDHIDKYYPKWRESIPRKDEGNNDTEETRNDVIIGWEGTKYYFIKKHNMIENYREDWDYIFKQSGKKRLTEPSGLYN